MNIPAAQLGEQINSLMGGGYHTYFVNSGSEANEAGFKIARQKIPSQHVLVCTDPTILGGIEPPQMMMRVNSGNHDFPAGRFAKPYPSLVPRSC